MEKHPILSTLAFVNSRFHGTPIGDDAQRLFAAGYNEEAPIDRAFATDVILSFFGTEAWDAVAAHAEDLYATRPLPEVTREPLPDRSVEAIKKLSRGILNRFAWLDTPEGGEYWDEVMANLGGLVGSGGWAHDVSTTLVQREEQLHPLLGTGFVWSETPQGYSYWSYVYWALVREDRLRSERGASTQYDDGSQDPEYAYRPTEDEREELFELAQRIDSDILWYDSKYGDDFWRGVFEKLLALSGREGCAEGYLGGIEFVGCNTDAEYEYPKHRVLDINLDWALTEEGMDYWESVYDALRDEAGLA